MADLKPLGSEKLNSQDKLKRILELTYYGNKKNNINEGDSTKKVEQILESKNSVYGIVKEKDGYYVKRGLNESSLDYIGGLFMKNKNRFKSYAEALKRCELLRGQDLQEATKYVLKQSSPDNSSDMGTPIDTPPPATTDEPSSETPPTDTETPETGDSEMDGGSSEPKPSDYMAEIQKFAGKLGQELRDQKSKMESDDIKYVLNMIISAVDLNKLSEEDLEEIGKKFDREEAQKGGEKSSDEAPELSDDETQETPQDEDLGETMNKLSKFVSTPAVQDEEIDLRKYADIGMDEEKEIDLDEIKSEINKSIAETLGKYFK